MPTGIWTSFLLALAGMATVAWLVALMHESGVRPVRGLVAFLGRQPKVGRVLLGALFIATWIVAGTKPDGGSGNGSGGGGGGGDGGNTNNVQMAIGSDGGLQPSALTGATDALHAESQNGLHSTADGDAVGTETADDGRTDFTPGTSTNTARALTAEDFARGFVMHRVGTGEAFDFAAPPGATVCADWEAFGAAEDWFYLSFTNWMFRIDASEASRFRVFSFGQVDLYANQPHTSLQTRVGVEDGSAGGMSDGDGAHATNRWFAPFRTSLGIVPRANWPRIAGNGNATADEELAPSRFWHFVTPSNTLLLTWQNVLFGRRADAPLSFQAELWPEGRFMYRYDLSRCDVPVAPNGTLTNVLVGASLGGPAWTTNALLANVTSLAFHLLTVEDTANPDPDGDGLSTADELFVHGTDPRSPDTDCDGLTDYDELFVYGTDPLDAYSLGSVYSDGFAMKIGDADPLSCPEGSTNTILEHLFYSGTADGAFDYPRPSEGVAVLRVSAAGSGTGDLVVGGRVVPLVARRSPATEGGALPRFGSSAPPTLLVPLARGETYPLYVRGDGTLSVSLGSDDFAFGVLPTRTAPGHINFPNTVATAPCIHDFNARRKDVSLPMGRDARFLTCTWQGGGNVEVENNPPRAATITGNFSARSTSGITYTLSHPEYLFGKTTYDQTVRFCPRPPDPGSGPDPGAPHPEPDPPWYSVGEGDDSTDNHVVREERWCCHWGACGEWCECGCDCESGDSGPADDGDVDGKCPVHSMPYADCACLHADDYTNAVQNVQHLGGVLYIREPPFYEQIHLDVPTEHRNCCPCPDHWTNYVGVAYKSYRLRLVDANGLPFSRTETSCDVNLAGIYPSSAVGVELPYSDVSRFSENSGLMVCEAKSSHVSMRVDIKFNGELLYSYSVPMAILPVKQMYSWINSRHLSGDGVVRPTAVHRIWDEQNTKSLIFLHGANVNEAQAEQWGDVLFKRLWVSGVHADFYNVDWRSNIGGAANYHENASNAFVVASRLAPILSDIPGDKVIMAHSLGNMVASSMIQDYGLQVSRYLMCNSAVPAEAYDTSLTPTNVLVHKDWNGYPRKAFASEWYRCFEEEAGDDRQLLTWGGRFADVVAKAVNFYSTGDHVLELYDSNNVGATDGYENWDQMFERYAWHKQELWKGRKGVLARIGTTDWAGWSIRESILGYNAIQPTNAWLMSAAELKTNTVFKLQPESMNTNSIPLLLRGALLAKGIPSRTPASGAMKWGPLNMDRRMINLESTDENVNGLLRPNGWVVRSNGWFSDWGNRWLHSDIKDVSYFFVFKFYQRLKEEGALQ